MKSRSFLSLSILVVLAGTLFPAGLALQAQASSPAGPPWYVRGDWDGWAAPGVLLYDDGTHGDLTPADNVFTSYFTVTTAARYEWKATDGTSWYPPSNAWLVTTIADQRVTFTFDTNTRSDGWSPSQNIANVQDDVTTWTAIGDWQGWDNGDPATAMHAYAGGLYAYTGVVATAGAHEYKVCRTGTWDCIGPEAASGGRSINTANLAFATTVDSQRVLFLANLQTGRIRAIALSVVINEAVVKGTEWVELHNPLPSAVDIGNWILTSDIGDPTPWSYTFPGGTTIPAGGYLSVPTGGAAWLNNDGDIVRLSMPGPVEVDAVGYGMRGGAPTAPTSYSVARTPNGNDTDDWARDWNLDNSPTQAAANDAAGVSLGSSLILNEFDTYPDAPANDKAEIYNPTDAPISMAGWFLSDGDAVAPIVTGPTVPAHGWVLLEETVDWTVSMDLSVYDTAYLFLPDRTRVDQIGWYNEYTDDTLQRICDGDGPHDGYDWASSGGGTTFQDLPQTLGAANCLTDVAVDKSGPAFVANGQRITYTLTYEMLGLGEGQHIVVTDTLPADVTYVAFTSLLPITLTGSDPLVWDAGALDGYAANIIYLVADVATGLPFGTLLTNTVAVDCDNDSNANNNQATWTSEVVGSETGIAKAGPVVALPGRVISYTVSYQVDGEQAQGMVITDTLPADVTYISDTAPVAPTEPISGTLVWNMGTRSSGSFAVYGLVGADPSVYTTTNQAWITASNDTGTGNNYVSVETAVAVPIYDLQYVDPISGTSPSPWLGEHVYVFGVVVAGSWAYPSGSGNPVRYVIADENEYGPWQGLFVYDIYNVVTESQLIVLAGTVNEYYGMTELDVGADDYFQVLDADWPVPAPILTTTAALTTSNPQSAEPLESVLVEVSCAEVTRPDLGYGEWGITDPSGVMARVDDLGDYTYVPTLGDVLMVRGVLFYSNQYTPWNFKLEPRGDVDIVPAVGVVATGPSEGAIDVAVNANVTATFNVALDPTTVNTATFFLQGPGGILVPGSVSYDAGTRMAALDPGADLVNNTNYVAHLTTGIRSELGVPLCAEYAWSFTTIALPEPDLRGSEKLADRAQVQAGGTLTYTIRLLNSGELTASALLTDIVPAEVTVLTPTLPPGMVYDSGRLLWGGEVYPDQPPLLLSFQAQVHAAVPTGTTIVNEVWIDDGVHLFTKTASVEVTDAPDIVVAPLALSAILQPGQSTSRNVTVQNVGLAELFWLLSEVPAAPWLAEDPNSGQVPAGGQEIVAVTFDATGLSVGSYTTTLDVTSTDPDEPHVYVDVTLAVSTGCVPVSDPLFTWTPPTPTAGQAVTFHGTATGLEPITYAWSFGDGGTGSGADIQHTFAFSGTYTVVMTATNACGEASIAHDVPVVGVPQPVWKVYLPVVFKNGVP